MKKTFSDHRVAREVEEREVDRGHVTDQIDEAGDRGHVTDHQENISPAEGVGHVTTRNPNVIAACRKRIIVVKKIKTVASRLPLHRGNDTARIMKKNLHQIISMSKLL